MRQKVSKNTTELVLCRPSTPEHGACTEVWLTYFVRLHWRNLIFFFVSRYQPTADSMKMPFKVPWTHAESLTILVRVSDSSHEYSNEKSIDWEWGGWEAKLLKCSTPNWWCAGNYLAASSWSEIRRSLPIISVLFYFNYPPSIDQHQEGTHTNGSSILVQVDSRTLIS